MWHTCPCWAVAMFNIWSPGKHTLFSRGGGNNKLGHTFWVSGWFGRKGALALEERDKGGGAKKIQDAQAVVDQGCWVVWGASSLSFRSKKTRRRKLLLHHVLGVGFGIVGRSWTILEQKWAKVKCKGFWMVELGRFGSLISDWLTNVDVPLSLPAVLEVMDKWMANLTLRAKVQHQSEKSSLFAPTIEIQTLWFLTGCRYVFLPQKHCNSSVSNTKSYWSASKFWLAYLKEQANTAKQCITSSKTLWCLRSGFTHNRSCSVTNI